MKVRFQLMHPSAVLPAYGKPDDNGLDLTATEVFDTNQFYDVRFGVAVEIPDGHVGLIVPRSSITKTNMMYKNSVGVIDQNYRGEMSARFKRVKFEDDTQDVVFQPGERCAQLLIIPCPKIESEAVLVLSETNRGTNGYGSSGK